MLRDKENIAPKVSTMKTAATAESPTTPNLSQRLESLPFTRKHTKLLGVTGIGWALDAMDVGLISFIMAALTKQWALSPTETSWLGSIGFLGMALGATVGGLLADRFGRRYVFAATLLIYGLATGASALAGSLAVLMVFRFIVGLGLGAGALSGPLSSPRTWRVVDVLVGCVMLGVAAHLALGS